MRIEVGPNRTAVFGTSSSQSDKLLPGFEELAMPLFDSLYHFARWLVHTEVDAEDLVQETYLKALHSFASFQPGTNFRAWMFKILKKHLSNFMLKTIVADDRCRGLGGGLPRFTRDFRHSRVAADRGFQHRCSSVRNRAVAGHLSRGHFAL
jgi:RNA polymerase sigma factor (sigma-70 family)